MDRPETVKVMIRNTIVGRVYRIEDVEPYFDYLEKENELLKQMLNISEKKLCPKCGCVHAPGENTLCEE